MNDLLHLDSLPEVLLQQIPTIIVAGSAVVAWWFFCQWCFREDVLRYEREIADLEDDEKLPVDTQIQRLARQRMIAGRGNRAEHVLFASLMVGSVIGLGYVWLLLPLQERTQIAHLRLQCVEAVTRDGGSEADKAGCRLRPTVL